MDVLRPGITLAAGIVAVFIVAGAGAAPPHHGFASAYQCGDGTPDLKRRACLCPAGTIETRTERGVARCEADPTPAPAVCPTGMKAIPGGAFRTGVHGTSVTIAPFCIDTTEVTVAAFDACVLTKTCTVPERYDVATSWKWQALCNEHHPEKRDLHPVNCVKWAQANAYCTFVNARLPTEDEWEWVARNGDRATDYPWGSTPPTPQKLNACGSECPSNMTTKVGDVGTSLLLFAESDGHPETAPVGTFPQGDNRWGVHDLAGNVAEWTSTAVEGTHEHVARGGSWRTGDHAALAMSRVGYADSAFPAVGFRCARTP